MTGVQRAGIDSEYAVRRGWVRADNLFSRIVEAVKVQIVLWPQTEVPEIFAFPVIVQAVVVDIDNRHPVDDQLRVRHRTNGRPAADEGVAFIADLHPPIARTAFIEVLRAPVGPVG